MPNIDMLTCYIIGIFLTLVLCGIWYAITEENAILFTEVAVISAVFVAILWSAALIVLIFVGIGYFPVKFIKNRL